MRAAGQTDDGASDEKQRNGEHRRCVVHAKVVEGNKFCMNLAAENVPYAVTGVAGQQRADPREHQDAVFQAVSVRRSMHMAHLGETRRRCLLKASVCSIFSAL